MLDDPPIRARRRRPRRRAWPRVVAILAAVALAFVLGLSLGKALNDGPEPGVTVTSVRTLEPLPQEPATTP
jgi:hypothetical protein